MVESNKSIFQLSRDIITNDLVYKPSCFLESIQINFFLFAISMLKVYFSDIAMVF